MDSQGLIQLPNPLAIKSLTWMVRSYGYLEMWDISIAAEFGLHNSQLGGCGNNEKEEEVGGEGKNGVWETEGKWENDLKKKKTGRTDVMRMRDEREGNCFIWQFRAKPWEREDEGEEKVPNDVMQSETASHRAQAYFTFFSCKMSVSEDIFAFCAVSVSSVSTLLGLQYHIYIKNVLPLVFTVSPNTLLPQMSVNGFLWFFFKQLLLQALLTFLVTHLIFHIKWMKNFDRNPAVMMVH